jgi:hypothetical protein
VRKKSAFQMAVRGDRRSAAGMLDGSSISMAI